MNSKNIMIILDSIPKILLLFWIRFQKYDDFIDLYDYH